MAFDISRLSSPTTVDQLAALRSLKNEIIGHVQRKEHWVRAGVLGPIVKIVNRGPGQGSTKDVRHQHAGTNGLSDEEAVKLHALQLLASFANAGSVFLPPLHAAGALPAVLNSSCLQHDRPQIVLAALRVLRDMTDAAAFAPTSYALTPTCLANAIFDPAPLASFALILTQPTSNRDVEAQVSLVARLISTLCCEERHQYALVNQGILDALATKLASFAVAGGQVIPHAEDICRSEGLSDFIPGPAKPGLCLADVLGAISAIITDSSFRTCRLLYSPSILAVFPNTDVEWGMHSRTSAHSLELAGLKPSRQKEYEPMDLLLPYLPMQTRGQPMHAPAFPPLGSSSFTEGTTMRGPLTSRFTNHAPPAWNMEEEQFDAGTLVDAEEAESPLVPWLVDLVRRHDGRTAVMATSVLTSLFKCGFVYKIRETTLGLLVVPKLAELLASVDGKANHNDIVSVDAATASIWDLIERTPATLARLITDSEALQKAASDSNAIKLICKLFKSSYDPPPPLKQPQLWSPHPDDDKMTVNTMPGCQLGEPGQHPLLTHRIKVRESTLKAIGALATFKEEYRKAIVAESVVPYMVESLAHCPSHESEQVEEKPTGTAKAEESAVFGSNPVSVIVEACYAVCMLSRSVCILRTELSDRAVATPLFRLLRHPCIEIQVAATATMCNLVTHFSPMRETLVDQGILEVLCAHTNSQCAALRLNALWALKHLVESASVELKRAALEELTAGWLVQLICDDTEDEALYSARSKGDRQAQSALDDTNDVMDLGEQSRPSFYKSLRQRVPTESRIIRMADARLAVLREAELNPVRKARKDDLAIQEQGLGFIRNLIGGGNRENAAESTNDSTEMIDLLLDTLEQGRFFDILSAKLRVKVLHAFSSRRGPTSSDSRVLYPQAKIIESVVYILVHMAASIPRHRQLVISQTELLRTLAGLFSNQHPEVRVALCHLVNNLTWQDDVNDASACNQRTVELRKLGFVSKLETLGQNDEELDVRERAKSALWQMKHGY